ncbi:winged helix-turn-helix domain-containing protein [Bordetella pseudohinzii]|nr:winged helix-turn-helix domain-containing protein [Bordetella pseudohinzii]ANY14941.1 two-component response regulator [Bordetella pseudohinzii]KMM25970.1 two-component response regulator [Bordetella pseudohinzii]KXA78799.1 two-component response regulator [Bordetella pseudohinzii]KXA79264.1 two-component response regulator [Bordetella pseudohinzii]
MRVPSDFSADPSSASQPVSAPNAGVLLLCVDFGQCQALSQSLVDSGFPVASCTELSVMYELHGQHRHGFVILAASPREVLVAAARLRTLAPSVGIVALTPPLSSEARVQLLLCGVDTCLEQGSSHQEIAAVLQALARRGVAQALASPPVQRPSSLPDPNPPPGAENGHAERGWRLLEDGWVLASPDNARLTLTGAERALLQALVQAPTQRLSREDLLDVVDVRPGRGERARLRYVDVLICRLRRKATDRQLRLPIRAVHGWGYMFSGNE